MILEILLGWLLGFVVLAAVLLTLHEFVQFKLKDQLSDQEGEKKHPTTGKYFHLFVPSSRSKHYEKLIKESAGVETRKGSVMRQCISGAFALLFIAIVGTFVSEQKHKLFPPVDLGKEEIKGIKVDTHQFVMRSILPAVEPIKSEKQYVLIKNDISTLNRSVQDIVRTEFEANKRWANSQKIKTKFCHWERIQACSMSAGKHVLVVQSGYWKKALIEKWLNAGLSILITGAPLEVLESDSAMADMLGIQFESFRHIPARNFGGRVSADQVLTLGIPAGTGLAVQRPQHHFRYRAQSKRPQIQGVDSRNLTSQFYESVMDSGQHGDGRWVWADFLGYTGSAEIERVLSRNILGFLEKRAQSSVAHWPRGKAFAALIDQDSEDKFKNSKSVIKIFKKHEFPITWFMLSELAEANRELVKQMAEIGEVACHGDNHGVFPDGSLYRQAYRLAKCQKTLLQLTGERPKGFRPPEEKYNTDTLSASVNSGYQYIFSAHDFVNAVPRFAVSKDSPDKSLLVFPRINNDDYSLWVLKKAPANKSIEILKEDINFAEQMGGLYTFSFHTQYMGNNERLRVIDELIGYLKTTGVFAATGSQIADWWVFRDKLIRGESVSPELITKYQPKIINLGVDGKLSVLDYSNQ